MLPTEERPIRLLLVAVLICLSLVSPASARTVFPLYGSHGETEVSDECPAGSFFVGLVGNVGSWVDQIAVICGKQMPDGSISGNDNLPPRGGNGGNISSVLCGKDEVVSEIRITRSRDYQISAVEMTCVNVNTLIGNLRIFQGDGGYFGKPPTHTCKTGELGTGLIISYGQYVNGVSLICNEFRRPVAAQPPQPPPPPPSAQLCRDYGTRQAARYDEYARLNCSTWAGERMTAAQYEGQCLKAGADAAEIAKYSELGLESSIAACKRAQLCRDFGTRQAARYDEYARLNCSTWAGERMTAAQYEGQCLKAGADAAEIAKYSELGLESSIAACKQGATTGSAVTKTVVDDVTLYDRPEPPQTECYLHPNDTVTVLTGAEIPQAFRNLDDDKWVPVKGASGDCTGRIGGVYDDGKLK